MGILSLVGGLLPKVAGIVGGAVQGRTERKGLAASAEAKVKLLQAGTDAKIKLSDLDIQHLRVAQGAHSWKDEFALILISFPMIVIMLEAVSFPWIQSGSGMQMVESINVLLGEYVEYGHLFAGAIMSSLGLKWLKK